MEAEIEELKRTLEQVHTDSKEIEEALERELSIQESEYVKLKQSSDQILLEKESWKSQCKNLEDKLNSLERKNDEYEERLRASQTSIANLEAQNQQLLERLALSEADIAYTQSLEAELERTRESLTEAQEEILRLSAKGTRASSEFV